jgi:hypothetical protein
MPNCKTKCPVNARASDIIERQQQHAKAFYNKTGCVVQLGCVVVVLNHISQMPGWGVATTTATTIHAAITTATTTATNKCR